MPRKYRIGVIGRTGHGNYGHQLDTAWFDFPQAEIVAVADDDEKGLAAAARRLRVDQTFSDYRRMLDRVKPDIVTICPRWIDQHRDMAVAAAERGIHIYMEKPFCRDLAEADEIVAACERTHVLLALALPTRYSPRLATVKRLIREGKIGRVLEYRGRGKEDRRGGGEDLWVLGSHVMDMIRAIGGHPAWCFAHVTREGKPVTKRDVVEGAEGIGPLAGDAVRALYGMPDGSTAHFSSHRHAGGRPWRYGLQIYGSEGILEIGEGILPPVKYLGDPSWSPGRSGAKWQDVSSAGIGVPEPLSGKKYEARHWLAIEDLIGAIEANRQPMANVYEARGATEMIIAVFESHVLGRRVNLPLENRHHPLTLLERDLPVGEWVPLFDGRTLHGWKVVRTWDFEAHGKVSVAEGRILLGAGNPATGIRLAGSPPRENYEISLEAMRVEGSDFFCGLTFPVGKSPCTLIVGGWGGSVVGLSNIDDQPASENSSSTGMSFENNRWYRIRLRVTPERIETWIDRERVIDLERGDHRFSIWWEQEPVQPLGIATWYTAAALRDIRLRRL